MGAPGDDGEEPLPPLPIDPAFQGFSPRRLAIVAGITVVCAGLSALRGRDDPPRAVVDADPGAGLPPAERAALEEAIRRGDPLVLGRDGRLHPATDAGPP